jgi:hypothetical protein
MTEPYDDEMSRRSGWESMEIRGSRRRTDV